MFAWCANNLVAKKKIPPRYLNGSEKKAGREEEEGRGGRAQITLKSMYTLKKLLVQYQ